MISQKRGPIDKTNQEPIIRCTRTETSWKMGKKIQALQKQLYDLDQHKWEPDYRGSVIRYLFEQKIIARLNKQEFNLLKCQYKMKRENPSPKSSIPDTKRNPKNPSQPKPTRFLIPPKSKMSHSGTDTSNFSENLGSPPKSRTSSTRTNHMDLSPRSKEEFDEIISPTYSPIKPSPQREMVSSSTNYPKKGTDREAFIRDYEKYTAERYPKSAPHWKEKESVSHQP